ncbi:MAG: hypothetical protein K9M57_09260, partial [Phycisphaerae bacterium]|nr:hypothetical protein [Phycisphaerae bacterium]
GVDEDGRFISGAITLGFTAWDTTMWKMGRISDGEYAFRMGVNATALAADALSGGFGGGLAVRSASLLGRAGSAANRVYRSSRALRTAGVGIRTLARTKNAQRIGTVGKVLNPIASVGEVGMGLYGVQQGISQGDIIGGIDSGRMTASTLRGFARSWHLITAPPKKLYPKARKSFYRVARSDKFREAFGAFDRDNATGRKEYADFLRMVRKAEFKKSNILQGGYAGLDNSKNIVLGLNPFYRNFQSSATHELIHLYRHYNNIMPFENEALMKGIYRYKAWKEEWQVIKQTYGRIK